MKLPSSESNIEQVKVVKLLGFLCSNHLSFIAHVNGLVLVDNQKFCLMKLLHAQGLVSLGLSILFDALVLAEIAYASQVFCAHLQENDLACVQSCLDKFFEWGI